MDFSKTSRRDLLRMATLAVAGAKLADAAAPQTKPVWDLRFEPKPKVRIGFIGTGGRGNSLIENFSAMPEVRGRWKTEKPW